MHTIVFLERKYVTIYVIVYSTQEMYTMADEETKLYQQCCHYYTLDCFQ